MNTLSTTAARRVRLIGLDVDGVLTDNGVFIGPVAGQRVELKRFDIQDGLGLILLRTAGLPGGLAQRQELGGHLRSAPQS